MIGKQRTRASSDRHHPSPSSMAYTASSLTPSRPAPSPSMYSSSQSTLVSSQSTLASNGYGPAFTFNPSSPAGSSYSSSYSGIGGSPSLSNGSSSGGVVRQGPVSVKEDGTLTSWIWKVKWLVLKEMTLTLHKSEVRCSILSPCSIGLCARLALFLSMHPNAMVWKRALFSPLQPHSACISVDCR